MLVNLGCSAIPKSCGAIVAAMMLAMTLFTSVAILTVGITAIAVRVGLGRR